MLDYLRLISGQEWVTIFISVIAILVFLLLVIWALKKSFGGNTQLKPPIKKAVSPEEGRRRRVREAILSTLSNKYPISRIQLCDEAPFFVKTDDVEWALTELVNEGFVIINPVSAENVPPECRAGFDEIIKVKQAK